MKTPQILWIVSTRLWWIAREWQYAVRHAPLVCSASFVGQSPWGAPRPTRRPLSPHAWGAWQGPWKLEKITFLAVGTPSRGWLTTWRVGWGGCRTASPGIPPLAAPPPHTASSSSGYWPSLEGKPSNKKLLLFYGIFPKWSDPPPHFWNFRVTFSKIL